VVGGCAALLQSGCERRRGGERPLRIWSHQGQESEQRALQAIVADFRVAEARERFTVEMSCFPDFQYLEPLLMSTRSDTRTVQVALAGLFTAPPVDWGAILACAVLRHCPCCAFFAFFNATWC
jgi:hypothetical protein